MPMNKINTLVTLSDLKEVSKLNFARKGLNITTANKNNNNKHIYNLRNFVY